jgi:hypothetical protein
MPTGLVVYTNRLKKIGKKLLTRNESKVQALALLLPSKFDKA